MMQHPVAHFIPYTLPGTGIAYLTRYCGQEKRRGSFTSLLAWVMIRWQVLLGVLCLAYLLNLSAALLLTKGVAGVRRTSQQQKKCWSMSTSGADVEVEVISDFACPW